MDSPESQAEKLWRQGLRYHGRGQLNLAMEQYRLSLLVHPTAEAHTYLGWALSNQEETLDEAIACCKRAIAVDPEFGNPYNDIGCYLMQAGKFEEAIPWFKQAKKATRYESPQFPCMNLGRILLLMGRFEEARVEFAEAVKLAPEDVQAQRALQKLVARFN